MPRAAESTAADMSDYAPTPPVSIAQHPIAAPVTGLERSRVMLASLPGVGSGPDAVLRQFNGGRACPHSRIFVP